MPQSGGTAWTGSLCSRTLRGHGPFPPLQERGIAQLSTKLHNGTGIRIHRSLNPINAVGDLKRLDVLFAS